MSNKLYGPGKPIKTRREWEKVFKSQAAIVAKTLNISMDQATLRQQALLDSGILEKGDPGNWETQKKIDMFLQGIGQPIKYFKVYMEANPEAPGFLYGIEAVRDHGFSFVLKLKGEKMWVKDKGEAERVVKMFDERNRQDPDEMAQMY